MTAGKLQLEWDADGKLTVKTTLQLTSADSKKLMIQVLLDAAKSINEIGTRLVVPNGAPVALLGGQ